MVVKCRVVLIALVALLCCAFALPVPSLARRPLSAHRTAPAVSHAPSSVQTPANTVILANPVDARFCRDFSALLKHTRLEWAILQDAVVPEALRDRNVVLVGRLDAAHTGEIVRGMLTPQESEALRAAGEALVLEKESPWGEGRRVTLAVGVDLISTRDAAETAIRTLIAEAPPAEAWLRTTFDAPLDAMARETVERLTFAWDDEELPLADLAIDVKAKPRRRVSTAEAAEDVERLFYLFSHAYAGYGFFNPDGAFERTKAEILQALAARSAWSGQDLARLFYERLDFLSDCHLQIGGLQYAGHVDFWYDTRLELMLSDDGVWFTADGARYSVASIDGRDPDPYLYPSLNARGEPIYRLGTLSKTVPAPLDLRAVAGGEERRFEVALRRSDMTSFSEDLFREDTLGGIPVIRIRTFSDHHAAALQPFVETAGVHQGAPVLIVDLRGNGGGNEAWPIQWIQGLTGERAEAVFIFSELQSQTTLIGRANVMAYMYARYPKTTSYRQEAERYTRLAEAYEAGTYAPNWTGPRYPQLPLIANPTTLILVTNEHVASSGEGMIMRASRAENVVVVGENSRGCLTFGNAGAYQLPHSRMMVYLPINFGLYPDLEFREETGLAPDLWVPAADAVNYVVAAVRSGTIRTHLPLTPEQLQQPFVPEDTRAWARRETLKQLVPIALLVAAGSTWAYFNRKRPLLVVAAGGFWLVAGCVWSVWMKKPIGYGFLLLSGICLVWGCIHAR